MARFVHRFTGEVAEHFLFLPADPPSQWLEPGQEVVCREPVEHPRLQLVKTVERPKPKAKSKSKPKPAPAAPATTDTTSQKEA